MAKWINMVETLITDPSKEDALNEWFDKVHLPDVMKTPGYLSAKRYVIREPKHGRGRYIAIYEIESDDIDKTLEIRKQYMEKEKELGRTGEQNFPGLQMWVWQWVVCKEVLAHYNDK